MATLNSLKRALKQKAREESSSPSRPLSDTEYMAGFEKFVQGSGWLIYQDFIIPQLSQLLLPLFNSRASVSVLEIGPGPKTVLGHLPGHLRQKVTRYVAIEPNDLYVTRLEEQLCSLSDGELPLPCLESPPSIHRAAFALSSEARIGVDKEKFDVILFCHSMYGMDPNHKFIEQALELLHRRSKDEMVVVFHRDDTLQLGDLACHRTASFPTGFVGVANDDEELDRFAPFAAGFVVEDASNHEAIRVEWRKVCRSLGRVDESHPNQLLFSAPNTMVAFNRHATAVSTLKAQVPVANEHETVKNRDARLHHGAAIMAPTEARHVQQCVQWALQQGVGLTIVGGGHSGHCLWPSVVAINMGAFDQVHIVTAEEEGMSASNSGPLVVTGSGCKTGDIVQKTTEAGLIVPLGARPSVGSGLWLQGGIGHLARLHGLSCDAIVGAVLVSVKCGQILHVGRVPSQHRPVGAVRPPNDLDLLWAIKGAGSNFGIVLSVTFQAHSAPTFVLRNWVLPLSDKLQARLKLGDVDRIATQLPRDCSVDAYLHWDSGQLRLGVTMFECSTAGSVSRPVPPLVGKLLGPDGGSETADAIRLFDTEMYMSTMHGGHGGGKTSAFKRCLFLKAIGADNVADLLVKAVETRPSPLCYPHLLHGGGAVGDIADHANAFGCRDWDFACVVTGVWPRDRDGTESAEAAKRWVYEVVTGLLPFSTGAYGADLGPDPRDAGLAVNAFGPNRKRLARLKRTWDPCHVLAYGCPLGEAPLDLIILVTGESGAGKDHCARVWETAFTSSSGKKLTARTVSISDETKREYAEQAGADLNRLLHDRAYKEQHRPALTEFWQAQVQRRPRLAEEHFLNVVHGAADVDVLLITGMRDEAPVVAFSHLVPESKLLQVCVTASKETRLLRGAKSSDDENSSTTTIDYRPSLIFNNDESDDEAAKAFAQRHLLPSVHEDLHRLASMVPRTPNFPRPGIEFRHVLNISQKPGGLALCTTLLRHHFLGDWANVGRLVCCEAGGFIFASALVKDVDVPLTLVRAAGKLPPPTISATKSPSHVSSPSCHGSTEERIEMQRDAIPKGSSVVVVDDVLATGQTLLSVLQLLGEAGIGVENIAVLVVAEFPFHRGRELLHRCGFGGVNVQSLLTFDGA